MRETVLEFLRGNQTFTKPIMRDIVLTVLSCAFQHENKIFCFQKVASSKGVTTSRQGLVSFRVSFRNWGLLNEIVR